jgi:hypothetical protein
LIRNAVRNKRAKSWKSKDILSDSVRRTVTALSNVGVETLLSKDWKHNFPAEYFCMDGYYDGLSVGHSGIHSVALLLSGHAGEHLQRNFWSKIDWDELRKRYKRLEPKKKKR